MSKVIIEAPAKINLHLEVIGKRKDGFHSIRSVFQLVSISDLITITRTGGEGYYALKGNFDFPLENNLITGALNLFRELTGIRSGVSIECSKVIPAGAGLGGGSSDAASVLKGLNILFDSGLSTKELSEAGSRLGSDIPFFFAGGTAVVTGRGEIVKPVSTEWDLPVIIIDTGIHVSTKEAYAELDKITDRSEDSFFSLEKEYLKNPSSWRFRNNFFKVLASGNSIYESSLRLLNSTGSLFSSISGSGSSVFGIFPDEKTLNKSYMMLKNEFPMVHKGKMLANPKEAVYNSLHN